MLHKFARKTNLRIMLYTFTRKAHQSIMSDILPLCKEFINHGCCPNLLLKIKLTAKNEKLISLAKTNFHKTYGQMIGQVCDISIREVHIQDTAQSFESLAYFSPDCSGSVIGIMHV